MSYELKDFSVNIKTIAPAYMQTNFGSNAQMTTHSDYQEAFNQYFSTMRSDAQVKRDTPESIAEIVYQAATDKKSQIHYTAGSLATTESNWLKKEGIEKVLDSIYKRFFQNKNNKK